MIEFIRFWAWAFLAFRVIGVAALASYMIGAVERPEGATDLKIAVAFWKCAAQIAVAVSVLYFIR